MVRVRAGEPTIYNSKKFKIITLGCRVNQFESDAIAASLINTGWDADNSQVKFCVINTCTVTGKGAAQSRQAIRKAIRKYPQAIILVTGCYAQTEIEKVRAISGVHYIVGHAGKHDIVQMAALDFPVKAPVIISPPIKNAKFMPFQLPSLDQRTRPILKIQDGCNARCTYCIVPRARGNSRSLPVKQVMDQIDTLISVGCQEVVLSGIHLGNYGRDLNPPVNLADLLSRLPHSLRIRLSSIEPLEINDTIINLARTGLICPHFHIPLQSGDDGILKKMKRPYKRKYFRQLVFKIASQVPLAAIGVDTLIGFPGEDETAFQNTFDLLTELPVTYLHVFPFSPRQGTPAADYPGQVPSKIIKTRTRLMRDLGQKKKTEFYNQHTDRIIKVLVEGNSKPSYLMGMSSNYIPVFFQGSPDLLNTMVRVRIEDITCDGIRGHII